MDMENIPRTIMTLQVTGSNQDNQLIVGLMNYIDDMMGLDYNQIAEQLDFVKKYAEKKANNG